MLCCPHLFNVVIAVNNTEQVVGPESIPHARVKINFTIRECFQKLMNNIVYNIEKHGQHNWAAQHCSILISTTRDFFAVQTTQTSAKKAPVSTNAANAL